MSLKNTFMTTEMIEQTEQNRMTTANCQSNLIANTSQLASMPARSTGSTRPASPASHTAALDAARTGVWSYLESRKRAIIYILPHAEIIEWSIYRKQQQQTTT